MKRTRIKRGRKQTFVKLTDIAKPTTTSTRGRTIALTNIEKAKGLPKAPIMESRPGTVRSHRTHRRPRAHRKPIA
jgi:hypothetical protein